MKLTSAQQQMLDEMKKGWVDAIRPQRAGQAFRHLSAEEVIAALKAGDFAVTQEVDRLVSEYFEAFHAACGTLGVGKFPRGITFPAIEEPISRVACTFFQQTLEEQIPDHGISILAINAPVERPRDYPDKITGGLGIIGYCGGQSDRLPLTSGRPSWQGIHTWAPDAGFLVRAITTDDGLVVLLTWLDQPAWSSEETGFAIKMIGPTAPSPIAKQMGKSGKPAPLLGPGQPSMGPFLQVVATMIGREPADLRFYVEGEATLGQKCKPMFGLIGFDGPRLHPSGPLHMNETVAVVTGLTLDHLFPRRVKK